MSALLVMAHDQLQSPRRGSLRRACWLARAALEDVITTRLAAKDIDAATASERAKLSCLEGAYVDDRELVARTEYAWSQLSDACHQHAYQLDPTYSEVKHLIGLVEELVPEA